MKLYTFSVNEVCSIVCIYLLSLLILPRRPKFGSSSVPHDVQTTFAVEESSAVPYDRCANEIDFVLASGVKEFHLVQGSGKVFPR